jgi:phosphatidylserine/phosphatidylglycerophosphate/cardiolipin synthase-like enzyme
VAINSQPGQWVLTKAKRARTGVDVVSPWLSLEPVEALLKELPDGTPLRVVFRWPNDASDARALDPAAIERLAHAARSRPVTLEYAPGNLHAKVVRIDNLALVTSANFTGGGR